MKRIVFIFIFFLKRSIFFFVPMVWDITLFDKETHFCYFLDVSYQKHVLMKTDLLAERPSQRPCKMSRTARRPLTSYGPKVDPKPTNVTGNKIIQSTATTCSRHRPQLITRTTAIKTVHVYLAEQTALVSNQWQARWTRLQRPSQSTQLPTHSQPFAQADFNVADRLEDCGSAGLEQSQKAQDIIQAPQVQVIGEIVQIPHVTEQCVPVVEKAKIVEVLQQHFIDLVVQLIGRVPQIPFIDKSSLETSARWIMSVELVWRSLVDHAATVPAGIWAV